MIISKRVLLRRALPAALVLALSAGSAAAAPETDFLARFEGDWAGSGSVQRNADEGARTVKCSLAGNSAADSVAIGGSCRAHLIFSREFGAEIRVDPATGRYSGVYRGSTIGPARLEGARRGDVVDLTIHWPETVNGDQTAAMQIINEGTGNLRILVSDRVGGAERTTTDLRLSRR